MFLGKATEEITSPEVAHKEKEQLPGLFTDSPQNEKKTK